MSYIKLDCGKRLPMTPSMVAKIEKYINGYGKVKLLMLKIDE